MASGKGNFLSDALLDHVFNGVTYTPPTDVDIALYTVAPTGAGGGTEVSTGGGTLYTRITHSMSDWSAVSSQTVSNTASIDWATAGANWGTVVAVGVFEAGTNDLMYWGNLTANRIVNTGDSVRFAIGGLVIGES